MPKKPRDEARPVVGRRARLTPAARAQAQRDALSRRVQKRAAHILRYGTQRDGDKPSWENFPWGLFFLECHRNPVREVNRVTGMPYVRPRTTHT